MANRVAREDGELINNIRGVDPNHNEEINTEKLLIDGFMQRMAGVIPSDMNSESAGNDGEQEFAFMSPAEAIRKMRRKRAAKGNGENEVSGSGKESTDNSKLNAHDGKISRILESIKNDAIALFQSASDDDQKMLCRMIRGIEEVQSMLGFMVEPFEKEKYLSGLDVSEADLLSNANSVMSNTVAKYKMHVVNAIETVANNGKPCIRAVFIGEADKRGFVAKVSVTAKSDFNGNEAIDFVPEAGGVFTVKAFRAGRWFDVSDKFVIDGKPFTYELERPTDEMKHSVFVGEKIAGSSKEIITSSLNLNNNDVRFGRCQAFCRNIADAERIKELIRVKGRK
jgi:hypothetical protein